MFKNLVDFLTKKASLEVEESGELTSFTLQVATAAVLWEVANSDNEYLDIEYEKIVKLLSKEFKLSEEEAVNLIDVAEKVAACDQSDELVQSINEHFSDKQKQQVLDLAIDVAQVDGALKSTEVQFVEKLKEVLGVIEE